MKKRLLALILALGMIQIQFPLFAEAVAADDDEIIEMLVNLDILADNYAENYKAKNTVTYGEYLENIVAFMSDEKPSDILDFADNHRLIRTDENISLDDNITYEEAMQITVRAGGYSELIPGNEDVTMYWKVAGERKLTDGINIGKNSVLTASYMLTLLYNAVEATITDFEYVSSTEYKITEKNDETILSRYRNICEVEGIVTDNGETALTGESKVGERKMVVGDVTMSKNGNHQTEYIGSNVRAFYKDDDGEFIFKYAIPTDNEITEILSDDVNSVNSDISLIEYEYGEKTKKIKIDSAVKVLYNGYVYFDYTADDFLADNTNLKFIDNNEDGKADVILITAYETVWVSYVTSYDRKIINRYTYDGAMSNIDIDTDSKDKTVNFYVNGEKVENPEISGRNVLSIAVSKSATPVYSIYISSETVTGTLESFTDDKYVLDGEEFEPLPEFITAQAAADSNVPEAELGKEYTFYLDINGKIAGIAKTEDGGLGYAVMLKLIRDDTDEEIISMRYMDSNGEWHTERLAKKVKIYNEEFSGKRLKALEVFNYYVDDKLKVVPQLVQIATDVNGNINVLKTAVETTKYDKDKLTKGNTVTGCYRWTTQMFSSVNGPLLYVANTYKIFTFPSGVSYNEEDYSVGKTFTTDEDATVIPYNMDKFMTSDCFVEAGTETGTKRETLFFVSGVSNGLDSDENVRKMLFGRYGSYEEISFFAKNDSTFNNLQKGDVIQLYTDARGRVLSTKSIFSVEKGAQGFMSVNYTGNAAGYVTDIDNETKSIKLDCGDQGEFVLKHAGRASDVRNVNVYLNDAKSKKVEVVDFSDILVGDFIITTVMWAEMQNIVIVRNY